MAISKRVWRRGWQQEAAETQVAAREIANFSQWLNQRGSCEMADMIRQIAMRYGSRGSSATN